MRILLADDSGTMRTILRRGIESFGIPNLTIAEAADGRVALSLFELSQYDLVLSDWNMPNMTGLELLQAIRERNKSVPVMMITTEAERDRVIAAIQAGTTDYLIKPFTTDELRRKLTRHLVPATPALASVSA